MNHLKIDGILPSQKWLKTNGFKGLVACMQKEPNSFLHLIQERIRKTLEEHVRDAEILASDNGNALPSSKWLRENGWGSLNAIVNRYPSLFSHINRERMKRSKRTIADWVNDAENLAGENGGMLPHPKWLIENGFSTLNLYYNKYHREFSHIRQQKLLQTIEDHVKTALVLSKENGGVLPKDSWLRNNGYENMSQCIRNHREEFTSIKQEKHRKTIDEHIQDAKHLIEHNNGLFPTHQWLKKNGYGGLSCCILRHKECFGFILKKGKSRQ